LEILMADYGRRRPGMGLVAPSADNSDLDQQGRGVLIAADVKVANASGMINTKIPPYIRIDTRQPFTDNPSSMSGSTSGSGSSNARTFGETTASRVLPEPVFDPPSPSPSVPAGDKLTSNGPALSGDLIGGTEV
jgi:hypothetical protein